MSAFTIAKIFSNPFTATAGTIVLVAAMCIVGGTARADSKTNRLSRITTINDLDHDHRRFRHRLIAIDDANADSQCRYQRTIHGLIEICPEPHSIFSAGQYVGRDPDPRVRGQMLNDFDRGATFPGGR